MSLIQAFILAVVEGLTEFLPVSSTGHLVISEALMGMESTEYVKAFTVMIQLGAILSVVFLYYRRFFRFDIPKDLRGNDVPRWRQTLGRLRFYLKLAWGCVPAVILGLLFNSWVDRMLGSVWVIAINLVLGGIFMLFIDRWLSKCERTDISYRNAFMVGLFQCIAIFFPGMSRSMSSIVGGMAQGLTRKSAAEFSFFLAVPTMLGATLLQAYKLYKSSGMEIFRENMDTLILGNVVSFIVALIAIKSFLSYLSKHGFWTFGVYRIIVGGVIMILILSGYEMSMVS